MKNLKWGFKLLMVWLVLFGTSWVALGDVKNKTRKKKRVKINFEDELLEGNVSNPNIFHLFHKKQISYGRLIKMRKDFLPEMRRTAGEL